MDTLSVHYNVATALTRQDRPEEALSHLNLGHYADRRLVLLVASQRIGLLARLGRRDEALREGRILLTRERIEGTQDELLAPVLGECCAFVVALLCWCCSCVVPVLCPCCACVVPVLCLCCACVGPVL